MRNMSVQHLVNLTFLDLVGKPRLRFRSNTAVPSTLHGKTVPTVDYQVGLAKCKYACVSNYVADINLCYEFLEATAHIPPDTPLDTQRLYADRWLRTPKLRTQYQWAQHYSNPDERGNSKALEHIRETCILKYFNALNTGTVPLKSIVRQLADIFIVGERIITRALSHAGVEGLEVAKRGDAPGSPLAPLRNDPGYVALTKALASARAQAYNREIKCTFTVRDVLAKVDGVYVLPRTCPVLRVPLDYTIPEEGRYGHAQHPFRIRAWRKSVTQGLVPTNTAVMSSLAARMIEGRKLSENTLLSALRGHPSALKAWAEWRRTYMVATTSPGAWPTSVLEDE